MGKLLCLSSLEDDIQFHKMRNCDSPRWGGVLARAVSSIPPAGDPTPKRTKRRGGVGSAGGELEGQWTWVMAVVVAEVLELHLLVRYRGLSHQSACGSPIVLQHVEPHLLNFHLAMDPDCEGENYPHKQKPTKAPHCQGKPATLQQLERGGCRRGGGGRVNWPVAIFVDFAMSVLKEGECPFLSGQQKREEDREEKREEIDEKKTGEREEKKEKMEDGREKTETGRGGRHRVRQESLTTSPEGATPPTAKTKGT